MSLTSPFKPKLKMKTLDIFIFLKSPYAKDYGRMFCFNFSVETKKFVIFNGFLWQLKLNLNKKNCAKMTSKMNSFYI